MDLGKKLVILIVIVALVVGGLLVGCAPAAPPEEGAPPEEAPEVFHWRMPTTMVAGEYAADVILPHMIEFIKEESKGRLIIDRYYAGEVCTREEMVTTIGGGVAEMGELYPTYVLGTHPEFELVGGIAATNRGTVGDAYALGMMSELSEIYREILAEENCQLLGWHTFGPYPMLASTVAIRKLEDFKGVKIRSFGAQAKLFEALGAAKNAIFVNCMPLQRGVQATAEVVDGPMSVIYDEAENRLHTEKTILSLIMG